MKIKSVDVMMLQSESIRMSKPVLCRINTDEGIYGYGEAGATFLLGSESVFTMIQEMAPKIIGMDPMANEVIWSKLFDDCYWTKGNGAILMSAVSALDTAVWDIKGKALGKPLYALLGGRFNDKIRCYASQLQFGFSDHVVPQFTLDDYRNICNVAMGKGYSAIKIDLMKFGEKPGEALCGNGNFGHLNAHILKLLESRIAVIRETVGPECDIILEQHCATTLNTAIQVAKVMEPFNLMYMEEPLAPLNPELTSILSKSTTIPLTTGERSYLREGFLPFFKDRSLSMIQPDLGLCGGITEGKKICDMANTYDIGVQAHVCGTPVSVATGLHLECSIPNFTIHETHVLSLAKEFKSWGTVDFTPVNGYLQVPEGPGLGVELTDAFLDKATINTVCE